MPSVKVGDKVLHKTYGSGKVLETETIIARVLWDNPSLSQWEDEDPAESFWTDMCDLKII